MAALAAVVVPEVVMTHGQLLAQDGRYAGMWRLQQSEKAAAAE